MGKIKKIISLLLAMLLTFSLTGTAYKVQAAGPKPSVTAHAYVIIDANTGDVIYSQDENKKIYPASTTKMLTALVAIENCSLSKKITVKQSVLSKVPSSATKAGLKAGYTYTLEELLNMLLVYSAADAADTIADGVSGSTSKFVELMNKKAKALGMNNSSFDNTIGMDGRKVYTKTYSTANDIAKLTRNAMTKSVIRNIVIKPSYTIKNYYKGSSKTLSATNLFLRSQWYPKDLYQVIGSKTGTTNAAGYVLAATAKNNDGREVICVFGGKATRIKMYQNIQSLLTYTFKNSNSNEIKITKGFYDVRYSPYKSIIEKYLNMGIVQMNKQGEFLPNKPVTQKEFIATANKILKSNYPESNNEAKMTILEVANLFKDINNGTSDEVSQMNVNQLNNLYALNILPPNYAYNENSIITKELMLVILDKLSQLNITKPSELNITQPNEMDITKPNELNIIQPSEI